MAATTKITTLKLLIDKKSKRVVYADVGKDFVDFLFGLMQVPLDVVLTLKLSSSSTIDSVPLLRNFVSKKRKCESSYDQYGTYGSAKAVKVYPSSSIRGAATSSKEEQGFVRVMSLLNQYRVKDFSSLEEKTVVINFDKGLELVKASFASDTVLSPH
ncbi:hypothetical protein EZV62_002626 [Acer yangbiense]|uniref:DUF674 domain-containing protein n=1 Tax=Acer yangbiense TaxID=1000413 RepID=A0A5C7IXN0_9ROSI|nr:hypothetical protein EZV62_002626 [Acer yangbiense]